MKTKTYIIRKIVIAKNIKEAIKKEKRTQISEIIVASLKEEYRPMIGLAARYVEGEEK